MFETQTYTSARVQTWAEICKKKKVGCNRFITTYVGVYKRKARFRKFCYIMFFHDHVTVIRPNNIYLAKKDKISYVLAVFIEE